MSADPWELLKEAHRLIQQLPGHAAHSLWARIDAALASTQKQAEPVAWREKELGYVIEEFKRIRVLGLNEMRDALADMGAWAANRLTAAPPDSIPREVHDRLIREARRNAFLEAARIVEHEAFPSELPRFRVATDVLRDRADELDKEQK